jgi:hypothetical protein
MFYASWTSPHEGPVETLRFHPDQNPLRRGLGNYTDVDGVVWHVHAIMHGRVNARRVNDHETYYSTATPTGAYGTGNMPDFIHTWPPCDVEIVPRPS